MIKKFKLVFTLVLCYDTIFKSQNKSAWMCDFPTALSLMPVTKSQ